MIITVIFGDISGSTFNLFTVKLLLFTWYNI